MKDEADYLSKALGSGLGGVPWMDKNEARKAAQAVGSLPPISEEEGRKLNQESNVNNPFLEEKLADAGTNPQEAGITPSSNSQMTEAQRHAALNAVFNGY